MPGFASIRILINIKLISFIIITPESESTLLVVSQLLDIMLKRAKAVGRLIVRRLCLKGVLFSAKKLLL
jgi:hypothetical protein